LMPHRDRDIMEKISISLKHQIISTICFLS
jgi:hypothetical protein